MAYVKLDTGVLDSTLWTDRDGREVFLTALLMAVPHEVTEPTPALQVRTLESSGFVVPPGWYGKVAAAGVGIARRAGIDVEAGLDALERLCGPDPESRTPDHEGRRMVRVDGGYLILNFMLYRDRDTTAAERQQRYRERHKHKRNAVGRDGNAVTSRNITEAVSSKKEAVRSKKKEEAEEVGVGAPSQDSEGQEGHVPPVPLVSPGPLTTHFAEPAHADAYNAYRRSHSMPDGYDAGIKALVSGMHGKPLTWESVGGALVEMRAASASFSPRAVQGFARKLAEGPSSLSKAERMEAGRKQIQEAIARGERGEMF